MYSKQALERAMEILGQRRRAALDEAEAMQREAFAKNPALRRIDEEMRAAAGMIPAAALAPDGEARIRELTGAVRELQTEKARLLAEMKLTPMDLEPCYRCADCSDTGYLPSGARCACLTELIRRESCRSLPAPVMAGKCSFDTFDLSYYSDRPENGGLSPRQKMERVLARCVNYAESFGTRCESLLFVGHTGLGKTHLSLAIATQLVQAGYSVLYTPVQTLLDRYERIKFDRSPTREDFELCETAPLCDLLILDDLGAEFFNSFSASTLYSLLNDRLMAERPIIVSTNLEPQELDNQYGERIASRLLCGCTGLRFCGADIRLEKRRREIGARG